MVIMSNSLLINSASSEEAFTGNDVVAMHWYEVTMYNPTRASHTLHNTVKYIMRLSCWLSLYWIIQIFEVTSYARRSAELCSSSIG